MPKKVKRAKNTSFNTKRTMQILNKKINYLELRIKSMDLDIKAVDSRITSVRAIQSLIYEGLRNKIDSLEQSLHEIIGRIRHAEIYPSGRISRLERHLGLDVSAEDVISREVDKVVDNQQLVSTVASRRVYESQSVSTHTSAPGITYSSAPETLGDQREPEVDEEPKRDDTDDEHHEWKPERD